MLPIPGPVRRFIEERIESVGVLEVLLLLHSEPGRSWTADELSRKTRSERHWAEVQLEYLRMHTLVTLDGADGERAYRYAPRGPGVHDIVDQLGEAFRSQPVNVIKLIFRQPSAERLAALEAYRLRRR
jgi:hypothetical protein